MKYEDYNRVYQSHVRRRDIAIIIVPLFLCFLAAFVVIRVPHLMSCERSLQL
jgi:hypothetical protein